jgi:hypothetical protein
MKQAITVNKSQHIEIEGNTEVSAVSLDFRKKTDGN